jgi:transcriptional regulator GlxA family with amidase domain
VVVRAEAFLERNLHRSLARREVAASVNLSEPHLARIVRAATGRSVLQRLTELRVLRAKALLLESTLSISQIAGRVGFGSFSHFTKVFRKAVGVAPSDYRRSGGKAWH